MTTPAVQFDPTQLEALAEATVTLGKNAELVSKATGIDRSVIQSAYRRPEFQQILDARKNYLAKTTEITFAKMLLMLDDATASIEEGFDKNQDIKVRLDTAWKLLDRVMPAPKSDANVNHTFGLDPETQKLVSEAVQGMRSLMSVPKDITPIEDDPRLIEGEAALPHAAEGPEESEDT